MSKRRQQTAQPAAQQKAQQKARQTALPSAGQTSQAAHWTCPSCKAEVLTPYCARCGEEPLPPHELTFKGLAATVLHALTSVDARVMRTAATLLRRPGALTLAWTEGMRRPYVAPFALFLIANVLFFALQSLTGANVFSSTLDSHLHHQDWQALTRSLLADKLAANHLSLDRYAPIFDRAVVLHAKSFILLMALPFALLLPLVFLRERRPFMLHVVFAVHLYTFLLLLFCAALLMAQLSAWAGTGGLDSPQVDTLLTLFNLLACAAYLFAAIAPVYRSSGLRRVLQALGLTVAVGAIVLGYRFLMLLITLAVT